MRKCDRCGKPFVGEYKENVCQSCLVDLGWPCTPLTGDDYIQSIRDKLTQEELLAQMAEEAMELGHAALKLRRAYDGTNPTPVKRSEAFENIKEEIADVRLLIHMLNLDRHWPEYDRIAEKKLKRWAQRLEEVDHGEEAKHKARLEKNQATKQATSDSVSECEYCLDEFCVNDECPMCADYCPVPDYPGVCRYEDRGRKDHGTTEKT